MIMKLKPFVPATGVERQFAWLSRFPHGSGDERALSDAIRNRARARGMEVVQDELGNVLVRKPAARGRENSAPLLLQAHMDMVCTKVPGCDHCFATDPIRLMTDEDGWLCADGTSLGADDGYGVAYMLEMLFNDDVKHPPLECLFTVQEEVGLIGAAKFDTSLVRARRMISMDSGGETVTTVSTCGGRRIDMTVIMRPVESEGKTFRICIGGLSGGHSAGEIHRGRANAVKLLSHVMMRMESVGAALIDAGGGEAANAIPRDAWAVVRIPSDKMLDVAIRFAKLNERFSKLFHATDPDLTMTIKEIPDDGARGYDPKCLRLVTALPDGVRYMDPERPGVVALSDNVGTLRVFDGRMTVQCMIRSANTEYRDQLSEQLVAVGAAFGARTALASDYPGMEYNPHSAMRGLYAQLVREEFGCELREESTHGGMEIGYFARSIPGVDIVTLGPVSEGCHSPSERMDLKSFNRMYGVLAKLVERTD